MGHLYKGGMWFKKKSVLLAEHHYDTEKSFDGTDWRTNGSGDSWSVSHTLPSAADANNYFYLPFSGYYDSGQLKNVGDRGHYWSSSAYPASSGFAYTLYFDSGIVGVGYNDRYRGFRVSGFE